MVANIWYGVELEFSSNNRFYHNNFVDNSQHVFSDGDSSNIWDDGYPIGGNYWDDYTGTDMYSGPYQNETGSDGIGDTPYVIDQNNKDKYPLIRPWIPYAGKVSVEILYAEMNRIGNTTAFTGQMNVTMFSKDISALDVLCRLIITVPYGKKFYSDTCYGTISTVSFPNVTIPTAPTGFYGYQFSIIDLRSGNVLCQTRYLLKYILTQIRELEFWHYIPANSPYTEYREDLNLRSFDMVMINMTFTEPCKYFMFNMSAWGDYGITFLSGGVPVATRTLSFINGESKQLFLYNIPPTDFSIQIMLTSQKGYIRSLGYSTGPKMEPVPDIKIVSAECLNKFGVTGGNVTFDIAYAWNITSQDQVLIEIFYETLKIGEKKQTIAPFLSARDETLISAHLPNVSGELCLTINVSLVQAGVSDIIEYHLNVLPSSVGIHGYGGPIYFKSEASWNIWDREFKTVDKTQLEALEVNDIKATEIIYDQNANPQYAKIQFNARNKYQIDILHLLSANVHYVVGVTVKINNKQFYVPLGLLLAGESSNFEFFAPVHLENNEFVVDEFGIIYERESNAGFMESVCDIASALLTLMCPKLPELLAPLGTPVKDVAKYFLLYYYVEFYSGKISSDSLDYVLRLMKATDEEKQIIEELQRRGFTNIQAVLGIVNLRKLEGRMCDYSHIRGAFDALYSEWFDSDPVGITIRCFYRAIEKVAPEVGLKLIRGSVERAIEDHIKIVLNFGQDVARLAVATPQVIVTTVAQLVAPRSECKWINYMELSEQGKLTIDPALRVNFNIPLSDLSFNVTNTLYLQNLHVDLTINEATLTFQYDKNSSSIYALLLDKDYARYYLALLNFNASTIDISTETEKIIVHALGNLMGDCKRLEFNINQTNIKGWAEASITAYFENGHFTVNRTINLPFGNKYITSVALTLPGNASILGVTPAGYNLTNNTIIWNISISQFVTNFTAPTDICICEILVPNIVKINQEVSIEVIMKNNGSFQLAINVGLNCTGVHNSIIGVKSVTIDPGESISISFTWIPALEGRYEIKAYTSPIPNDISPENNAKTSYLYST